MTPLPLAVRNALAPADVITDPQQIASYTTDWTGRFSGPATAVVRPRTAEQAAAALAGLSDAGFAIQIQGGNTGLVGGSIPPPDCPKPVCLLTTTGLQQSGEIDNVAGSLVVGAGIRLSRVHHEAARAGWRFGVDLAARDSATIGGMIATNAGGIRVCAFGMMRENVTGVELALIDGSIVSDINQPHKNNVGLAIPSLAIGSEGILGLVTSARLKLVRPPGPSTLMAIPVDTSQAAIDMLSDLTRSGAQLLAAEYVDQRTLQRVMEHSGLPHLLDPVPPLTLFIEIAGLDFGWQPDERARLAQDSPSKRALWAYREQASDSWTAAGEIRKLDVSLPLPAFANFAAELTKLLNDAATVTDHGSFGHLADGNLHIEVLGPGPTDTSIDRAVLELVTHFGGSISAEHGIGRAKAEFLSLAHDPSSLELMRSVKRTFDPQGILNPGVIFPEAH